MKTTPFRPILYVGYPILQNEFIDIFKLALPHNFIYEA
jgi:hypothetical protein